jgi:hypothetical protein
MSDKLILEFYDPAPLHTFCACIYAAHGGDSPSSAAVTLLDFFEAVSSQLDPRWSDAGLLAAKFVVWESAKSSSPGSLDFIDVAVIPPQRTYGYQLVRLYTQDGRPHVHCVPDQWTTEQELRDAATILHQPNVDPPEHATMSS